MSFFISLGVPIFENLFEDFWKKKYFSDKFAHFSRYSFENSFLNSYGIFSNEYIHTSYLISFENFATVSFIYSSRYCSRIFFISNAIFCISPIGTPPENNCFSDSFEILLTKLFCSNLLKFLRKYFKKTLPRFIQKYIHRFLRKFSRNILCSIL